MKKNNELQYDGLQLSLIESNKLNSKLLDQMRTMNILILLGFILIFCFAILLYYYIDSHDLLYYLSGR